MKNGNLWFLPRKMRKPWDLGRDIHGHKFNGKMRIIMTSLRRHWNDGWWSWWGHPQNHIFSGWWMIMIDPEIWWKWTYYEFWWHKTVSGWWLGTFFFPYIRNNHPNWLSYSSEGLKPPTRLYTHNIHISSPLWWGMGHFYHLGSGMIFSSVAIREKSWTMRWRVAYFQRKPTYWWMWNRWIPPDCPVSNLPWKNVPYILRMDAIESEETNHCQSEFTIQICNWWYPLETFDLWCVCVAERTHSLISVGVLGRKINHMRTLKIFWPKIYDSDGSFNYHLFGRVSSKRVLGAPFEIVFMSSMRALRKSCSKFRRLLLGINSGKEVSWRWWMFLSVWRSPSKWDITGYQHCQQFKMGFFTYSPNVGKKNYQLSIVKKGDLRDWWFMVVHRPATWLY